MLGADHHQFHLADGFADDVVRENLARREQRCGSIQLAAFDLADQLTAPARRHLGAQFRVFDAQMLQGIEQHHVADGLWNAQAQQPGGRCVGGHQFTQGVHLPQDQTALFIHSRSDQSGLEWLGVAVEQLHAQRLLKVLHAAGNGRLSQLQRLRRMADGLATNHLDEGIDIINFHLART